jgi:hypothetical protein
VEEITDPIIKIMDKDYFEMVAASSSEITANIVSHPKRL